MSKSTSRVISLNRKPDTVSEPAAVAVAAEPAQSAEVDAEAEKRRKNNAKKKAKRLAKKATGASNEDVDDGDDDSADKVAEVETGQSVAAQAQHVSEPAALPAAAAETPAVSISLVRKSVPTVESQSSSEPATIYASAPTRTISLARKLAPASAPVVVEEAEAAPAAAAATPAKRMLSIVRKPAAETEAEVAAINAPETPSASAAPTVAPPSVGRTLTLGRKSATVTKDAPVTPAPEPVKRTLSLARKIAPAEPAFVAVESIKADEPVQPKAMRTLSLARKTVPVASSAPIEPAPESRATVSLTEAASADSTVPKRTLSLARKSAPIEPIATAVDVPKADSATQPVARTVSLVRKSVAPVESNAPEAPKAESNVTASRTLSLVRKSTTTPASAQPVVDPVDSKPAAERMISLTRKINQSLAVSASAVEAASGASISEEIKQDATTVVPHGDAAPVEDLSSATNAVNIVSEIATSASIELPVVESSPIELPANPLFQSADLSSVESSPSVATSSEIESGSASSEMSVAEPVPVTAATVVSQLPEVQLSGNPLFSDAASNPLFAASTSNIESVAAPVEIVAQPVADVPQESEVSVTAAQLSDNPLLNNAVINPLFASGPESIEPVVASIPESFVQPEPVASQQSQLDDKAPLSNNPLFGAVEEPVVDALPAVSESAESTPIQTDSVIDQTVTPTSETVQAVVLSGNPMFAAPLPDDVPETAVPVIAEVAVTVEAVPESSQLDAVVLISNPLFPDAVVNPLFSVPSEMLVSIDPAVAKPAVDSSVAAAEPEAVECVVESVKPVDSVAAEEQQISAPDAALMTNPLFDSAINVDSTVAITTEAQPEECNAPVAEPSTEEEQVEDEEPAPRKVMAEIQTEAFAAPPARVHAVPSPVQDDRISVGEAKPSDCLPTVETDRVQEAIVAAKTDVIVPEVPLVESATVNAEVEGTLSEQDASPTTDAANETQEDEQTDLTLQDMSSRILDEAQQRQNAQQEQTAATRQRIANMALDLHQSLNTQADAPVAAVSQPTADMIDLVALIKERNEQAKKAEAEFRLKLEADRARKLQANQVTIKIQPADIKKLKPKKLEKAAGIVLLGGALSLLPHEVRYTDVELKRIYHEFTKRWNAFYVEQKTKRVDSSDVIQDPIGMHAQILLSVLISWIKADSSTVKARLDSHFGSSDVRAQVLQDMRNCVENMDRAASVAALTKIIDAMLLTSSKSSSSVMKARPVPLVNEATFCLNSHLFYDY